MQNHMRPIPMYGQYPPYVYPLQPHFKPSPNKMVPPAGYQKKTDCGCGKRWR